MLFFLCQKNCPLVTLVSLRSPGVVQDAISWSTALLQGTRSLWLVEPMELSKHIKAERVGSEYKQIPCPER